MIKPGDSVNLKGEQWVVVDITGDGAAVLRRPDDDFGYTLESREVEDLTLW